MLAYRIQMSHLTCHLTHLLLDGLYCYDKEMADKESPVNRKKCQ